MFNKEFKVELCLIVWNEVGGCRTDIPNIDRELFSRVFAIDGGSTDGTIEYLKSNNIVVKMQRYPTYNGIFKHLAEEIESDAVIIYHPKGTISPKFLKVMLSKLESGNDMVVGSRMLPLSQNEEDFKLFRYRKWFVQFLALTGKLKWGRNRYFYFTDPIHGFRGLSKEFLKSINFKQEGVTADLEMIKHAYATKGNFSEISVIENPRLAGDTHFPAFKTGKALLKYLFRN